MSLAHAMNACHPSEVTGVVVKALREYLDEVSELRVEDLDVAGMAAQLAARIRFGWPETIDADPTPPHGIRRPPLLDRPPMIVYALDSEPHPSAYLHVVR